MYLHGPPGDLSGFSHYVARELNLAPTSQASIPPLNLFVRLIFETESYIYIRLAFNTLDSQHDFELLIILPLPPRCEGYRCACAQLVYTALRIQLITSCVPASESQFYHQKYEHPDFTGLV